MNYFDIVLSLGLCWGFYKGYKKGLIKEVFDFIAIVFGVYSAINFSHKIDPLLKAFLFINEVFLPLLSFIICFIGIVLAVKIIAGVIEKIITLMALNLINRLIGAVFGLLKMGFVMSGLILLLNYTNFHFNLIPDNQKKDSVLYPFVSNIVTSLKFNWNNQNQLIKEGKTILKEVSPQL